MTFKIISSIQQVEELENKLSNINPSEMMKMSENNYVPNVKEKKVVVAENKTKAPNTQPANMGNNEFWKKVINSLRQNKKMMLYTTLLNSRARQIDDLNIEIEFPNGLTAFNEKVVNDPNNKNDLIKAIFAVTGKEMNLKFKDGRVKSPETKNANIYIIIF